MFLHIQDKINQQANEKLRLSCQKKEMSNQRSIKQFAQSGILLLELYIVDKFAEVKLQCFYDRLDCIK